MIPLPLIAPAYTLVSRLGSFPEVTSATSIPRPSHGLPRIDVIGLGLTQLPRAIDLPSEKNDGQFFFLFEFVEKYRTVEEEAKGREPRTRRIISHRGFRNFRGDGGEAVFSMKIKIESS